MKNFERVLRIAGWPLPLRRLVWWIGLNIGRQRGNYMGTFGLSVVSSLGTDITHPISPLPLLLNYGVIDMAGGVDVRIVFDHRSIDGAEIARALSRLEELLLGPILAEILDGPQRQATK